MFLLTRDVLAVLVRLPCFFFDFLFFVATTDFGLLEGFAVRSVLVERTALCLGSFLEEVFLLTIAEVFFGLTVRFVFFLVIERRVFFEELFLFITVTSGFDLLEGFVMRLVLAERTALCFGSFLEEVFLLTIAEVFFGFTVRFVFFLITERRTFFEELFLFLVATTDFGSLEGFAMRLVLAERTALCFGSFLEEAFLLTIAEVFFGLTVRFVFVLFLVTERLVFFEELFLLTLDEVFFALTVRFDFVFVFFAATARLGVLVLAC